MDKSINSMAKGSYEALQTQKAIETLATMKVPELTSIVEDMGQNKHAEMIETAQDITADFIKQPILDTESLLPQSEIVVYKGIIKRLSGVVAKENSNTIGILAGKDNSVSDVILGHSIDDVLNSQEVHTRWMAQEYSVLGMVVFEAVENPEKYKKDMLSLQKNYAEQVLVLLAFDGSPTPKSWNTRKEDHGDMSFTAVSVGKTRSRHKGDKFAVLEASKVGVSYQDEVRWLKNTAVNTLEERNVKQGKYGNTVLYFCMFIFYVHFLIGFSMVKCLNVLQYAVDALSCCRKVRNQH